MYSMVVIVNNTVMYLKVVERDGLKCFYHTKKEMVIM